MAVDTEKLKASKPGATQEETNSVSSKAGLYRHPGSKQELVTLYDPLYGDAQSEAAIRVGFERVGDAPEGYVKTLLTASLDKEQQPQNAKSLPAEDLKGLQARLSALEAENSRLKEQGQTGTPGTEVPGAEDTKLEAARRVVSGEATGDAPVDNSGVNAQDAQDSGSSDEGQDGAETPLAEQKRDELNETARAEGVENPESFNTKADLVEAIEAQRAGNSDGSEEGDEDGGNQ